MTGNTPPRKCLRALAFAAMATSFPLLPATALGQSSPPPLAQTPCASVLHVWVDPHYGVDPLFPGLSPDVWNPSPTLVATAPGNSCSALDVHPFNVTFSNGAFLLHAPAPFRTVTAAVAYVEEVTAALAGGVPGVASMPVQAQGGGVSCDYAIIHCLPGIYTNRFDGDTEFDSHNFERRNGETFPIQLPNRCSIQGTSALNTVFVLSANPVGETVAGPIFEFGADTNNLGRVSIGLPSSTLAGQTPANESGNDPIPGSFIDSVSMTGAIQVASTPSGNHPAQQAAVHIHQPSSDPDWPAEENRCLVQISNCFIYNNGIGVLVDSQAEADFAPGGIIQPPIDRHLVRLINNTFTWNLCGVWNGNLDDQISGPRTGYSVIQALNNVFDATPPLADVDGQDSEGKSEDIPYKVESQPQSTNCGSAVRTMPYSWSRWVNTLNREFAAPVGTGSNSIAQGMTCFEGLGRSALQLADPTPGTTGKIPNAYEFDAARNQRKYNTADPYPPGGPIVPTDTMAYVLNTHLNLPVTITDPADRLVDPAPGTSPEFTNIAHLTGGLSSVVFTNPLINDPPGPGEGFHREPDTRGILYVRDMFHEANRAGALSSILQGDCGNDLSISDFRICPTVAESEARFLADANSQTNNPPPGAGRELNPLIDAGIEPPVTGNPILMAPLVWSPGGGLTLVGHEVAEFCPLQLSEVLCRTDSMPNVTEWNHGPFDFDAEGHGNPRVMDCYYTPSGPLNGNIDLGADEMAPFVVAGMRSETTSFYFFDTDATTAINPNGDPREIHQDRVWLIGLPRTIVAAGDDVRDHRVPKQIDLTASLAAPTYSFGATPLGYYFPLYVDTIPHLLPDIHPFWAAPPYSTPSNLLWQECTYGTSTNQHLYTPPDNGIANPSGLGSFEPTYHRRGYWLAFQDPATSTPVHAPLAGMGSADLLNLSPPGSIDVEQGPTGVSGLWPIYVWGTRSAPGTPIGSPQTSFRTRTMDRYPHVFGTIRGYRLSMEPFQPEPFTSPLYPFVFDPIDYNAQSVKIVYDLRGNPGE